MLSINSLIITFRIPHEDTLLKLNFQFLSISLVIPKLSLKLMIYFSHPKHFSSMIFTINLKAIVKCSTKIQYSLFIPGNRLFQLKIILFFFLGVIHGSILITIINFSFKYHDWRMNTNQENQYIEIIITPMSCPELQGRGRSVIL